MLPTFLIISAIALTLLYIWNERTFSYWRRKHVKHLKPFPLLGNFKDVMLGKKSIFQQTETIYNASKEPLIGFYLLHRPAILLRDLQLVKQIMVLNCFTERILAADPAYDPIGSYNLAFARNPEWQKLRKQLSPIYTSANMKQMYPLMLETAKDLENLLQQMPNNTATDVKSVAMHFTTDLIGTIAYGLKANSLNDSNSEFYLHNTKIFKLTPIRAFQFSLLYILPNLASRLGFKFFSNPVCDFVRKTVQFVMNECLKSGQIRNDLIDLLIKMKRNAEADANSPAIGLDFLAAQVVIFQTAGFETSSSAISFAIFEMARHPQMQERLREEILIAFGNNDSIGYEAIQELPYLAQVVNETLRMYPVLAHLERVCTPAKQGSSYSLRPYCNFDVPAGMPVLVSALGIHYDAQYWPEPHTFDPERFAPENRDNINWNAYMPFGTEQRNCIGMRLGLLITKLGIAHFLRQHRVLTCDQTPKKIEFDSRGFVLSLKGSAILKIQKV